MRLNSLPRFFRFAIVGCAGYGVDVGTLYVAVYGLGAGLYWGRVFSYLCASSSTWYMNRLITFADVRSDKFAGEWLKFVLLNGLGGVVNYMIYAIYLHYGVLIRGDAGCCRSFGIAQRPRRQLHSFAQTCISWRDGKMCEAAMRAVGPRCAAIIGYATAQILA